MPEALWAEVVRRTLDDQEVCREVSHPSDGEVATGDAKDSQRLVRGAPTGGAQIRALISLRVAQQEFVSFVFVCVFVHSH